MGWRNGGWQGWQRGLGGADGGWQVGKWGAGVSGGGFRSESGRRTGREAIFRPDGRGLANGERAGRTERGVPEGADRTDRTDGVARAGWKRAGGTGGGGQVKGKGSDGTDGRCGARPLPSGRNDVGYRARLRDCETARLWVRGLISHFLGYVTDGRQ